MSILVVRADLPTDGYKRQATGSRRTRNEQEAAKRRNRACTIEKSEVENASQCLNRMDPLCRRPGHPWDAGWDECCRVLAGLAQRAVATDLSKGIWTGELDKALVSAFSVLAVIILTDGRAIHPSL